MSPNDPDPANAVRAINDGLRAALEITAQDGLHAEFLRRARQAVRLGVSWQIRSILVDMDTKGYIRRELTPDELKKIYN
jgi:hypothetical protein